MRDAMKFYEEKRKKADFSKDKNSEYLNATIEQSLSYKMTRRHSPLFVIGQKLKFMHAITDDTIHKLVKDEFNLFSKLFGNSVGMVATRKGKLYNREDVFEH